jgi:hypothetical protein
MIRADKQVCFVREREREREREKRRESDKRREVERRRRLEPITVTI